MAARGEEEEIGKADAVGQPRGQRVAFEMVHGEKRLAGHERQRLRGGEPDEDAADQAGTRRRRDAVDVVERAVRLAQRPRDQPVDDLHMRARRDLRHDAAIGGVLGDLAQHLVRQDLAASVIAGRHDGGGGLVAGRLDAEDAHGIVRASRWRRAARASRPGLLPL